jgi:hypothetical protein
MGSMGQIPHECAFESRGGSRRMHTDGESVQHARASGLGRPHLAGKPLVIESRVPLVMARRKRVEQ